VGGVNAFLVLDFHQFLGEPRKGNLSRGVNEIVEKLSYAERLGTASPSKCLFPVTFIDQWRANLW